MIGGDSILCLGFWLRGQIQARVLGSRAEVGLCIIIRLRRTTRGVSEPQWFIFSLIVWNSPFLIKKTKDKKGLTLFHKNTEGLGFGVWMVTDLEVDVMLAFFV